MGIFTSKNKFNSIPKASSLPPPSQINQTMVQENESLIKLRRQLHIDAETFILNNLFLSIQFFENYEREIEDLRISNVSSKENHINSLLTEQQKHCLIPDTIHELIDKKVRFQSEHGPSKYHSEPLHVQRMLVAYDNIEVYNPSETSEYSSPLDGPIYRCVIESSNLKGYVRLKLKEIEKKKKPSEKNTNVVSDNDSTTRQTSASPAPEIIRSFSFDEKNKDNSLNDLRILNRELSITSNNDDVFITSPQTRRTFKGNSNLTPTEKQISNLKNASIKQINFVDKNLNDINEDSYGYATINDHYILKPLKEVRIKSNYETRPLCTLPDDCITSIQVQVFDDDDDNEDENENKLKNKYQNVQSYRQYKTTSIKRQNLFKKIPYLNSIMFAQHFGDIFVHPVGDALGFNQETIQISMMQGSIIYTDIMENGHVTNYEIIPSVTSSWPDEAYEWSYRTRVAIPDFRTKIAYRWPTPGMINRAKSLPCHIYPIGFIPKRGHNPQREFQWKLAFPAAERFLESYLSHPQLRCYLFLLTFYKSFIEPKETKLGLNTDHIRAFLFWECEKNYVRWPEDRLGEKIIILFKKLRTCLESQTLSDYFIPTRNLFENIPTCNLLIAHRRIADILENPVIYTLRALSNLKYTHKQFYPALDYKEIYEIIETDHMLQKTDEESNIDERNAIKTTDSDEAYDSDEQEEDPDIERRWYSEVYRRIQEEKLKQKQEKITKKRRVSVDSINYNIKPPKTLETISKIRLLKLFIRHFLEMARRSDVFDATQQGVMYLKHAENLTILLREEKAAQEDADDFFVLIKKVEDNLNTSLSKEKLPKIPAKNIQLYNNGRAARLPKPQILYGKSIIHGREDISVNSRYANVDSLSDTSSSEDRKQTVVQPKRNSKNIKNVDKSLNSTKEDLNKDEQVQVSYNSKINGIKPITNLKKGQSVKTDNNNNDNSRAVNHLIKLVNTNISNDNLKDEKIVNQNNINENTDKILSIENTESIEINKIENVRKVKRTTTFRETSTDDDIVERVSIRSLDQITFLPSNTDKLINSTKEMSSSGIHETSTDYDLLQRPSTQSLDKITIIADVHNTYSELLPSRIILQNDSKEEESTDL